MKDSKIITLDDDRVFLLQSLPKLKHPPNLLYRGSVDGWMYKDFHTKCDKKGPTVCLF